MMSQSVEARRRKLRRARAKRIGIVVAYVLLTAGSIMMIIPFAWTISSSLKHPDKLLTFPPEWIPKPVWWQNYPDAVRAVPLFRFWLNSFFLSTTLMLTQVATAVLAAYAFARMRFPGRDTLFLLYIGTMMVPSQVTLIPRFLIVRYLGLIDSYGGVMLPMFIYVLGTFIMRQYFLTLPYELEDAARIDGCGRLRSLWHIILPLAKPALSTVAIFSFKNTWNEFLWPLIVLNTYEKYPIQVGLAFFRSQVKTEWELLLAGTVIAMAPLVVLFLFGQRYFIKGISLTGMGGR
ncbi:MAG: carbohydrate ABC transporter permease [Firmicutes bacterium]|jgi:multiple sugar transport system permease protein|nr:carbohydrate ABC transporter permease [Bacillota bacterium]